MTELALTRIFSVTMYYHFAFLAISIALFGLERQRGVRLRAAATAGGALRRPLLAARAAFARRTCVAGGAGADPRRTELLAGKPGADAGDLCAGGAAVFRRRCRVARVCPVVGPHQRALRRRPDWRRARLPAADPAAEPAWRARSRHDRRGAWRRRRCRLSPPESPTLRCRGAASRGCRLIAQLAGRRPFDVATPRAT